MGEGAIGPEEPLFYAGIIFCTLYLLYLIFMQILQAKKRKIDDHSPKTRYLSVSNLFKAIGGLVLIFVFFYPERLKSNRKQPLQVNQSRWVLKDQANLYPKPDIKGKVLGSLKPGDKLDSIGETKYYYKVRLNSGVKKTTGYILKNKIGD